MPIRVLARLVLRLIQGVAKVKQLGGFGCAIILPLMAATAANGRSDSPGSESATLLAGLTAAQSRALRSRKRRLLVLCQPGCGGTEVLVRRVSRWLAEGSVPPARIAVLSPSPLLVVELRSRLTRGPSLFGVPCGLPSEMTADREAVQVSTIAQAAFALSRRLSPDAFCDVRLVGEGELFAICRRNYDEVLRLHVLQDAWHLNRHHAIKGFLNAWRLLHAFEVWDAKLPRARTRGAEPEDAGPPVQSVEGLAAWCGKAQLLVDVGNGKVANAFADSAARFGALLSHLRLVSDVSVESRLVSRLISSERSLSKARAAITHVAIEQVQDLTPLQGRLLRLLSGGETRLLAIGDPHAAGARPQGGSLDGLIELRDELKASDDGDVIELASSLRATPSLIRLGNAWAKTFEASKWGRPATEVSSKGLQGVSRRDYLPGHLATVRFADVGQEARWVAKTISTLITEDAGAKHDLPFGFERPLGPADVAIVLRAWATADVFAKALHSEGLPAILQGPDVLSRPESLAVVCALLQATGCETLPGSSGEMSLYGYVSKTLECNPQPLFAVSAACSRMKEEGVGLKADAAAHLIATADRLAGTPKRSSRKRAPTFVEAVAALCTELLPDPSQAPLQAHHLGRLQAVAATIGGEGDEATGGDGHEASGGEGYEGGLRDGDPMATFRAQAFALAAWAPRGGEELAAVTLQGVARPADAVQILSPEAARGRGFAAVFVVDLRAHVLPSKIARRPERLPFDGEVLRRIDPDLLADDESLDGERGVFRTAIGRSERYLFLSASGKNRSAFWRWLEVEVPAAGGVNAAPEQVPGAVELVRR